MAWGWVLAFELAAVAAAVFNALIWPFFLSDSLRRIEILVVPLVIAPLAAAFAASFVTVLHDESPDNRER